MEAVPHRPVADADELAARLAAILDGGYPAATEYILPMIGWLVERQPSVRPTLVPRLERAIALPDTGPSSPAFKSLSVAFMDDTVAAWREALARAEQGRIPNRYVHLARFKLAEALLADGAKDEASVQIDRVIREAPARGASLIARWARELLWRAGLSNGDASPKPPGMETGMGALTARERQVLALVAEGLTNPQIGQRLYISPKTASVHVSAILAKIQAANRAEAAAWYTARSDDTWPRPS